MSTKITLKHRLRTDAQPGFHLYDDALDTLFAVEADKEPPVYLRLEGVEAEMQTSSQGGVDVTVTIPRELARELGLLAEPAKPAVPDKAAPGHPSETA